MSKHQIHARNFDNIFIITEQIHSDDLFLIVIRVMVFNATVFQVYGGGQFY
jgi:hypothetical protein